MHHLALRIPSFRYITYRYVPHSLSTKFAKLAHTYYPLLTDKLFSSTIAPPYTVCRVAYSNNLTLKKPVLTNLATQIINSKTIACISLLCLIQPVPISTFPMSFIYKIQLNTSASVEGASILNIVGVNVLYAYMPLHLHCLHYFPVNFSFYKSINRKKNINFIF